MNERDYTDEYHRRLSRNVRLSNHDETDEGERAQLMALKMALSDLGLNLVTNPYAIDRGEM